MNEAGAAGDAGSAAEDAGGAAEDAGGAADDAATDDAATDDAAADTSQLIYNSSNTPAYLRCDIFGRIFNNTAAKSLHMQTHGPRSECDV